ncbi:MAG: hypothetical protein KGL39_53180 [Patescibacteria group bacterium]|nr:hypothetical protein [Patescibacteria group bacterium]
MKKILFALFVFPVFLGIASQSAYADLVQVPEGSSWGNMNEYQVPNVPINMGQEVNIVRDASGKYVSATLKNESTTTVQTVTSPVIQTQNTSEMTAGGIVDPLNKVVSPSQSSMTVDIASTTEATTTEATTTPPTQVPEELIIAGRNLDLISLYPYAESTKSKPCYVAIFPTGEWELWCKK